MSSFPAALDAHGDGQGAALRVAVIGGGISGLAFAHRLFETAGAAGQRLDLTIYEGSSRLGGVIRTVHDGGLQLESGPDTLVSHKPAGVQLCKRLGLDSDIVQLDSAKHRPHLLHRGELVAVPTGFKMVAPTKLGPVLRSPLFSPWGKLRIAMERFVPARATSVTADESLARFVERRFGRELVDRVAQPVMGSLFAADIDEMSLGATVPQLRSMERRFGSLTRAVQQASASGRAPAHGLVALRGGMEQLVETIAQRIPASCVRLQTRIETIERAGEAWSVTTDDGQSSMADVVVLACPAPVGAGLVAGLDPALADALAGIEYSDCATIHLVYDADQARIPKQSFGFFVPKKQAGAILACSFIHVKFPERVPRGQVVLRAFAGGALQPRALKFSDEELAERAHRALEGPLALRARPRATRVFRHPVSMPQFPVGFVSTREWIAARVEQHRGLFVCGGAAGALGLPDSIAAAEKTAERLAETVARRGAARATG